MIQHVVWHKTFKINMHDAWHDIILNLNLNKREHKKRGNKSFWCLRPLLTVLRKRKRKFIYLFRPMKWHENFRTSWVTTIVWSSFCSELLNYENLLIQYKCILVYNPLVHTTTPLSLLPKGSNNIVGTGTGTGTITVHK